MAAGPQRRKKDDYPRNVFQRRTRVTSKINSRAVAQVNISRAQQLAWLATASAWGDLPETRWKPQKVLGAGGNGICGLWKSRPGIRKPNLVAVKQVNRISAAGLQRESMLLERIVAQTAPGGTEHIVKLYKGYHRDPGAGTLLPMDPSPWNNLGQADPTRDVARIYLEYCHGGDLEDKFSQLSGRKVPRNWSEEELWRLLGCLARAAVVLQQAPIAHFDIKPANILIGKHNNSVPRQPHHRLHPFKLADFGLALVVNQNNINWIQHTSWRATPRWAAPEQMSGHPQRVIGSPCNIFGLGMIMHDIMVHQGRLGYNAHGQLNINAQLANGLHMITQNAQGQFDYSVQTFRAQTPTIQELPSFFEACGEDLLGTAYSKHLIQLVHKCLAYRPRDRLLATQIVPYVDNCLQAFDALNHTKHDTGPMVLGQKLKNVPAPAGVSGPRYTAAERTAFAQTATIYPPRQLGAPIPAPPLGQAPGANLDFPQLPRRAAGVRAPPPPASVPRPRVVWQALAGGARRNPYRQVRG